VSRRRALPLRSLAPFQQHLGTPHFMDFDGATAAWIVTKDVQAWQWIEKQGAGAMQNEKTFRIAVLPGDGIGPEVMAPCLRLLDRVVGEAGGFSLSYEEMEAGAGLYQRSGTALPAETLERVGAADAILLGAMGLPGIYTPNGLEIAPQVDIREHFALFAGVRPLKTYPGMPVPLADPRAQALDAVLIRESTEGFFAGRGQGRLENDAVATETMTITRAASERLFDFAFELARKRKGAGHPGRVTCVDKANIFGTFAFFRKIFGERAARFPDVEADQCYVDAAAMRLVTQPWRFDVIVTENLFGDILSDLAAGLMGGMGMAPSADIGVDRAVFQPCHGTAPDIAGQGKANPTAMFLSAAMMLEWLGEQHGVAACGLAGTRLRDAVESAFAGGELIPFEFGGRDGTVEITAGVGAALDSRPEQAAAGG